METSSKALLWAISLSVVAAISFTAYIFLVQKNYDFVVEASCDPAESTCYYRDCSTGECPPNEFEFYRTFIVPASDFEQCADNSCLTECTEETIACEEIICDPEVDEECTSVEDYYVEPELPVFIFPVATTTEETILDPSATSTDSIDSLEDTATSTATTTLDLEIES